MHLPRPIRQKSTPTVPGLESGISPLSRFFLTLFLVILVITIGAFGYSLIEGWSFQDALYMTFITISTVGFTEVHPLSTAGRQFTVVLLILSFATIGYSVTALINFIFEGQILDAVKERRMERRLRKIKNHYIICGCGDIGREVAYELKRANQPFVVVDRDRSQSELGRDESTLFVEGDATEDEVLVEAGVHTAAGLVSALPTDERNLFVVLTARQLNNRLRIVSQANDEWAIGKLRKAGADRVISPKQIAGRRMAAVILQPSVVEFLDVVTGVSNVAMRVEQIEIERSSSLEGHSLRDVEIGKHTGAIVIGINDQNGDTRVNPSGTETLSSIPLRAGDVIIALGNEAQIGRLKEFIRKPPKQSVSGSEDDSDEDSDEESGDDSVESESG